MRLWILACIVTLSLLPARPGSPAADEGPSTARLTLPGGQVVTLELAVTPHQRSLGLMFRPALTGDHGMLFYFPLSGRHTIWMKNMLIPIDILWLDEERRIVHVEANVPPCRQEPCIIYEPPAPARYVIELAAGVAAQAGLKPGMALAVPAPPPN